MTQERSNATQEPALPVEMLLLFLVLFLWLMHSALSLPEVYAEGHLATFP